MIDQSGNKVGIKEYSAVLIMVIGLKATDSTPTLLLKEGKNAGWIIPIISSIVIFFSLSCLLVLLERYRDKNFIEIIYHLLGKYIGFIVSFIILGCLITLAGVNVRNYVDFMSFLYFPRTPIVVIAVVLIVSSSILAKLGFQAIGRTAWMVMPWIVLVTVLYIILTVRLLKIDYIYPIGGAGVKQILKGGIIYSTIFSELITSSIAFNEIKDYKSFKNSSYFALGYTTLQISIFTVIFLMVMDYPAVIINSALFHTVARLIYGGRFFSNLEAFFFLFWIIPMIIRFAMYMYTNTSILTYTLKLKNVGHLVYAVSGLILMIAMIPENYIQDVEVIRKFLINYSWIPFNLIPCVLLFMSQKKGDYKQ